MREGGLDVNCPDISANCQSHLTSETTLSASSSYDPLNVGPAQARLNQDDAGGAWCPEHPVGPQVGDQWLGLNTSSTFVISSVRSQGRYAEGQGQEYAKAYRILYWREGMTRFKEYRDSIGRNVGAGLRSCFIKVKSICFLYRYCLQTLTHLPWPQTF